MPKTHKYLENFTLTPIFALHSQNGIGLPDGVTVAQLFLVQFVLVRIQVRQPKKSLNESWGFFNGKKYQRRSRAKRAQWSEKTKSSLLEFWIGATL